MKSLSKLKRAAQKGVHPENHQHRRGYPAHVPLDASDRNRTSPFAFTGNKFEFRAVGSSQTCAWPMTVLNTIVAESLDEICTILEPVKDKPEEFHATLNKLLQNIIKKHKRILFSGDGYGEAWIEEAERRKLPNVPGTIEALAALETPKAKALFEKYKVVSPVELHAPPMKSRRKSSTRKSALKRKPPF